MQSTTPVMTITMVGLRGALTLQGSQPRAASCSLDGVMIRDLQVGEVEGGLGWGYDMCVCFWRG